jgi:SpoU rRNA methylase family enzyme
MTTTTTKEEDIDKLAEEYCKPIYFTDEIADGIEVFKAALNNKEESKEEVSWDEAFKKFSDSNDLRLEFVRGVFIPLLNHLKEHYTLIKK